jgi:hypothetical protein
MRRATAAIATLATFLAPQPAAIGKQAGNPAAPPQAWIEYGQLVSRQFESWLRSEEAAAYRLHRYLEDVAGANGNSQGTAVVIKTWFAPDGRIEKLEFPSLGNPDADADLHALLTRRPIAKPPPADMPQPLVLRLRLDLQQP